MSYDLYIFPERYDAAAIRSWFQNRPRYQAGESGAFYQNEETGVYFAFDFEPAPDPAPDADDRDPSERAPHVHFNLNYMRPHVFGLEAEPEVSAFVEAFNCRIDDPQMRGMGDGPYSREGFLSGWNAGNAFGYMVLAERGVDGEMLFASGERIEKVWNWNLKSNALQDSYAVQRDDVFVPHLIWGVEPRSAEPLAAVTWTRGIPTIIPACAEAVILVRPNDSLIGKLFGGGENAEFGFVRMADIEDSGALTPEISLAGPVRRATGVRSGFDAVARNTTFLAEPISLFRGAPQDRVLNAELREA